MRDRSASSSSINIYFVVVKSLWQCALHPLSFLLKFSSFIQIKRPVNTHASSHVNTIANDSKYTWRCWRELWRTRLRQPDIEKFRKKGMTKLERGISSMIQYLQRLPSDGTSYCALDLQPSYGSSLLKSFRPLAESTGDDGRLHGGVPGFKFPNWKGNLLVTEVLKLANFQVSWRRARSNCESLNDHACMEKPIYVHPEFIYNDSPLLISMSWKKTDLSVFTTRFLLSVSS